MVTTITLTCLLIGTVLAIYAAIGQFKKARQETRAEMAAKTQAEIEKAIKDALERDRLDRRVQQLEQERDERDENEPNRH